MNNEMVVLEEYLTVQAANPSHANAFERLGAENKVSQCSESL